MYRMLRADTLKTNLAVEGASIIVSYEIDSAFRGEVELRLPFAVEKETAKLAGLAGLLTSIFIGQLCLARTMILNFPCPDFVLDDLREVVQNLYDVRSYRENIELLDLPNIKVMKPISEIPHFAPPDKKAVSFWSGGVDSTLSTVLMKRAGYTVQGLHVHANIDANVSEAHAVRALSAMLMTEVSDATINFPQFSEVSQAYSKMFRIYPYENSVPHGRELLLLPIGLMLALSTGGTCLCFGHEREAWSKQIMYQGRRIYRCDSQSQRANQIFNEVVKRRISPHLSVFSAVAGYTDFNKFRIMAQHWPQILAATSSCFWGNYCGDCPKCLGYYLYQRALGHEVLFFNTNPIAVRNKILLHYLDNPRDPGLFTLSDFHFSISSILQRNDIRKGEEYFLEEYRKKVFPMFEDKLESLWNELTFLLPDTLIPNDILQAALLIN